MKTTTPSLSAPAQSEPILLPADVKIGSVSYLNARPLTYAIGSPVRYLEPRTLATELIMGYVDVGLVPLVEVLEHSTSYEIVDGVAIGSLQAVYSVFLNHTVPVEKIGTIALDPASKTSVQLARLLLEKFHGLRPRYVSPDEPADAQVIIGDPAIAYRQAHPKEAYLDLAEEWRRHTGLPFVFAVWAIRRGTPHQDALAGQLRAAAVAGLNARPHIAQNAFELRYLTEHLCYELGPDQKKSIIRFAELLVETRQLFTPPELAYL